MPSASKEILGHTTHYNSSVIFLSGCERLYEGQQKARVTS